MSQRRGRDEGPQPPGDGDVPGLPPEWGHIVVPDDPRELAVEAEQVRAELQAEASRNQPRGERMIFTRRWYQYGLSGPLVSLVLMVVAAMASLIVVIIPTSPQSPKAAPLATPTAPAGQPGGLLPDAVLPDGRGRTMALRAVRPAVLLLMPARCDCATVAADLVTASRDTRIAVELIGEDRPPTLPPNAPRTRVHALADTDDVLARALTGRPTTATASPAVAGTRPTAVLVRSDGVITGIIPDLQDAIGLRSDLAGLSVF